MQNILIDAGPLIALFDRDDRFHEPVIDFLKQYRGKLHTTWPVITETSHMLSFNVQVQIDFLKWIKRDAVTLVPVTKEHLGRIIEYSEKYSDLPMDLADSSLMVTAEFTGIHEIATIDSDYYIYRTKSKKALKNVLEKYLK